MYWVNLGFTPASGFPARAYKPIHVEMDRGTQTLWWFPWEGLPGHVYIYVAYSHLPRASQA